MALVCLCRGNFYWPPHTTILFCSIFLDKIVLDTLKSRYHRSAPLGMLNINQELLVAAVKSMQRKERHNGRWDNPNYTCWMNEDDKKRLARFLSNERGESGVYPWFSSTGRKKPWCE